MCGGRLEIVPCSHVGHIFRNKQPYKFPSGDNVKTFVRNSLRIVNVWLDKYKDVFYAVNPEMAKIPYGDISERLSFREKVSHFVVTSHQNTLLQLHNKWEVSSYVKNIFSLIFTSS